MHDGGHATNREGRTDVGVMLGEGVGRTTNRSRVDGTLAVKITAGGAVLLVEVKELQPRPLMAKFGGLILNTSDHSHCYKVRNLGRRATMGCKRPQAYLSYSGLVINNGALGIAILVVAFCNTTKIGNPDFDFKSKSLLSLFLSS